MEKKGFQVADGRVGFVLKMYTPDYAYYFYYPYVWREQINSLDSGEERGRLMNGCTDYETGVL
ncbi:MAG: hypothetical protein ACLU4J_26380 [Butyricimonas paravirosa]